MFCTVEEMKSVMYQYQFNQITDDDDTIVTTAIQIAEEEIKSYLNTNEQRQWNDGRVIYDVEQIFAATGSNRHPLILQYVKVCAKWHIVLLCNADIIYEQTKEAYDRVITMMVKVQKGEMTLSNLPVIDNENPEVSDRDPFILISREKFNHE